jgi:hypothetical protein
MSRGLRLTLSLLALLPVVLGIPNVVSCIVDVYRVTIDRVPPGEPMGMDALAYPVHDALLNGAVGVALIAVGLGVRYYLRRGKPVS